MRIFFISSIASEVTAHSQNGVGLIQLKCINPTQIKKKCRTNGDQGDGSEAKSACCQARQTEFSPQNQHDGIYERTPKAVSNLHTYTMAL